MKGFVIIIVALLLVSSCKKSNQNTPVVTTANTNNGGTFTTLFSFNGTNGENPFGSLIISGSTLYGMTASGGKNGDGIIFSINTNGSGFTDLHDFGGGSADGNQPCADLTLLGSTLYGTTRMGGANGKGVLFSIGTGGNGFTILHTFGNGTDGIYPQGNLVVNGATMYGTTSAGGTYGGGSIFSIAASGADYAVFYNFNPATSYSPMASITLSINDSAVYGTTKLGGGIADVGVIFAVKVYPPISYKNLVVFNTVNGANPEGSLLRLGDTLYGMASAGAKNSVGNIFSVDTNGNGYRDLFDFNGSNGASPNGSLIINGKTMYGMTNSGGVYLAGNIFTLKTTDSAYTDIFDFGASNFGSYPQGSLLLSNNVLYGMTTYGGATGYGTIFSCSL